MKNALIFSWHCLFVFLLLIGPLHAQSCQKEAPKEVKLGAACMLEYLPYLEGKRVGLVVNQTSVVEGCHLVDTLLTRNINVTAIFAPEHGFRGLADAGEKVKHMKDEVTGLPIYSLYGKTRKPTKEYMEAVDVLVFDIQDVGVRFYTYISTMHYVMEACAENGKPLIILDRPNPNGDYVDGPVLDLAFKSFVGMHPIPVVHGVTIGELALMINGEKWLGEQLSCDLKVIPVLNWKHDHPWSLAVKPSPNLPTDQAIRLYPSLCFFEGTDISVGRGTYFPFQVMGFPDHDFGSYSFTPKSIPGMAKYPKHEGKTCFGKDLREVPVEGFTLSYLLEFYGKWLDKKEGPSFFKRPKFFNLLAGTDQLRQQILDGWDEEQIRASWQKDLEEYKKLRKKYLLYP